MDQRLAIPNNVKLTPREKTALDVWDAGKMKGFDRDRPSITVDEAMGMYEMFLNGHSTFEIKRIANRSRETNDKYHLGQIVEARLTYEWDDRKETHLSELFKNVGIKYKHAQAGAIEFVSDLLSAAHRMYGDKVKQYLLTGDDKVLGEFGINNLTAYENVIKLLMKLTGQDINHTQISKGTAPLVNINTQETRISSEKPLSTEDVSRALDMLDSGIGNE